MIPEKLQTGFGMLDTSDDLSSEQIYFIKHIIAILMVLIKKAMEASATYVKHQGQSVVGAEEINSALKNEAMLLFDADDLEQQVALMLESLDDLVGQEHDDEGMGDLSDALIDDMLADTITQVESTASEHLTPTTCDCESCSQITRANERWETWDVSDDPVKAFLKHHITMFMVHNSALGDPSAENSL
jgi:hypothetical protein